MLKSVSRMKALTIQASDGEIGSVEDFYFDDETWAIRYLMVNTGHWLPGRLVLVSPIFLGQADWDTKTLPVALTKKQIENSPDIDTHKPVSRQHEAAYMNYFGASYYWNGPYPWGGGLFPTDLVGAPVPLDVRTVAADRELGDSHLRSVAEVRGYRIDATDGEMGHVEDFIVDTETWAIRYLEVNWNWLPGKRVLIAPEWIGNVNWMDSKVGVSVQQEAIKTAPEYIESRPITRAYEDQLHEHYGRPSYWLREAARANVSTH